MGERREKAVKGRCVIGPHARVMRGRNVSIDVNKGLKAYPHQEPLFGNSWETLFPNNLSLVFVSHPEWETVCMCVRHGDESVPV